MCVVEGQSYDKNVSYFNTKVSCVSWKWETAQPQVDILWAVDLLAFPCLVTSTTAMYICTLKLLLWFTSLPNILNAQAGSLGPVFFLQEAVNKGLDRL